MSRAAPAGDPAVTVTETGPPAPPILFRLVNPVIAAVLRSPLHWVASDSLLLLTFTGRRTGREYTTPVGYRRLDGRLLVFTHSNWWQNLRGGAPVTLRLRGEIREARAVPVTDPATVASYLAALIDEHGVSAANRIGLSVEGDGVPDEAAIERGIEDTVAIELDLDETGADG
jgi:deazaflavin-dependent oxidoreductase (nitroreductase family)